jgi:hypothetical protein
MSYTTDELLHFAHIVVAAAALAFLPISASASRHPPQRPWTGSSS